MSALLAVILATQSVSLSAPPGTVEEEVVVIGNKLKAWRARVRSEEGQVRCAIVKSTGDTEVDAIGCRALLTCTTQIRPQLDAMTNRKLNRTARRAAQAQAEGRLGPCLTSERSRLIEELAERRYQASR